MTKKEIRKRFVAYVKSKPKTCDRYGFNLTDWEENVNFLGEPVDGYCCYGVMGDDYNGILLHITISRLDAILVGNLEILKDFAIAEARRDYFIEKRRRLK